MPIVDTSVAVATPSTTAARITKGSASAGSAIGTRGRSCAGSRALHMAAGPRGGCATTPARRASRPSTTPGSSPPVNRAAIETPVTEPMVMSTRLGGMVSVCAPVAESSATSSPGFAPRFCISGNSTGATAAMSAAFEPEMPETRYMAPTST